VITAQGELKAYQFYPAVIHSAARLTYTEVAAILGNTKGPEAARRAEIVPHLQNLYDVYHALQKSRQERGAIDFETTETYIVCNPAGKIEKIIPRTRNDAHKLIEECMLAANVCAADLLLRHKHPGTYRIHAGPTKEKLTQVRDFLKQLGLSLGGGDTPVARDYADLMKKIKERPDAQLLQTMLLRSMQQAVYSPDNIGHFGLAYEAYAHFTSPIRRYPDLLTHRAIKAILAGKKYEPKLADKSVLNTTISNAQRRQALKDKQEGKEPKAKGDQGIWDALGVHCSANERRADEASRDVEAWLKCYFMQDKLGEEFSGIITGVTNFGIFVQLDQLFVEGLVHITDLGADYFEYDDARHELRGERTGKRYQLTGRVNVQVVRVDLESRKIDLRLADSEISTLPPQGKKPSRKGGGLVGSLGEFDSFDDEGGNPAAARKRKGARGASAPSISSKEEAPARSPAKGGKSAPTYAPSAPATRKAAKPKSKPKAGATRVTKAAKPKKKR
jgi:ribonuclease R